MAETPVFSQQNIALPDGTQTRPGDELYADTPWMAAYLRSLELVFHGEDRSKITVADVGCLEGAMAVEFARAGYDATGIEIRDINFANCQYVAKALGLPNLHFVQDDAWNIVELGPFDAVFSSGLLYHLDDPVRFLREIAKATTRALILETHFATARRSPNWRLYRPWNLSRMTTHEGYRGRWWREFSSRAPREEIDNALWSSAGNPKSFWIEKRHLVQAIRDAGFRSVYEQFDFLDNNVTDDFIQDRNRSLFLAIK